MSSELLITGASGYLGAELARRAPGAAGTYLHNEPPPELEQAVQADVSDLAAVTRVFDQTSPSTVIHTAYRLRGEGTRAANVDGTRAIAHCSALIGARLVHVSTDLVFDGTLGRPYVEDDRPNPVTDYGKEKLEAEEIVRELAPGALIVRTSLIYGGAELGSHERFALDAGERVSFFTDELRNPVQVGDLADALLELAATDLAGPLHVAGADAVSRYEFARLVVAKAGRDPDALRSGLAAEHSEPRPLDCRLDATRAGELLGTRMRGVREVLAT